MNVPEIYARVCAVCPEARVKELGREKFLGEYWTYLGESIHYRLAGSLIESAWTNLLKPYHMLHKDLNGEWAIVVILSSHNGTPPPNPFRYVVKSHQTRLETLEAYIMAELAPEQRSGK